nr:NAD(P)-dependent alcohol dehydrogenase [Micromonospora sp. DSM 115978]
MKAMVQHRYGTPEVLAFEEVDLPVVGDGDVLVRVRAASVNPYDWHHLTGTPYFLRAEAGLRRPKQRVRGMDLAGEVVTVGGGVTRFRPGDAVFGMGGGAFAEYVAVGADDVTHKPAGLTFEQAAAVPMAGLTALQGLRAGRIRAGRRVLINGASGGVGTFAIQLAKLAGAEVTAVCSTRNVATARSLGADRVVDYTRVDFTRDAGRHHLLLDIPANRSIVDMRRVLTPDGTRVVISGPKDNRLFGPATALVKALLAGRLPGPRMVGMLTRNSVPDLDELASLLAAGRLTPVVERTCSLPELPDALRLVGAGHARGKIVITM